MTDSSTLLNTPIGRLAHVLASATRTSGITMLGLLQEFAEQVSQTARSGVMSDFEIVEAIIQGHIILHPLVPENIKGSSVDIRLGEWFYVLDRIDNQAGFNMFDKEDVKRYFGAPKRAVTHAEWSDKHKGMHWENIGPDELIIVLHPHERTLNHTLEFIGIDSTGTTMMKARSTIGRGGVVVCKDAGWGDPGYRIRWTMEIQNDNDESVAIPVGTRVGQMIFFHLGPTTTDYTSTGKYDSGTSLKERVKSWTPDMMLPKAYQDVRGSLPDIFEILGRDEIIEALRGRDEFAGAVDLALKRPDFRPGDIEPRAVPYTYDPNWRPEPDWDDDGKAKT